jgi:Fe-coproporphyrin III synthase
LGHRTVAKLLDVVGPPILQVHASRRCNLRCTHCYSESGPEQRGGLKLHQFSQLVEDAAAEGYGVLNLSGGEPFMDRDLPGQIAAARAAGLRVNVITNGTLLKPKLIERVASGIDLVAVSLDGPPALHDRIRGIGQFARTEAGLVALRASGVRFAIIHTARPASLKHLEWLVRFARDQGAEALQLHPIEPVGRAAKHGAVEPGADIPTRLSLLHPVLEQGAGDLPLHLDVLPVCRLPEVPSLDAAQMMPLGRVIDPLVCEPDGMLSPFVYGFPRQLSIGSVALGRLNQLATPFRIGILPHVLRRLVAVGASLKAHHPWPFVNWHQHLAADL